MIENKVVKYSDEKFDNNKNIPEFSKQIDEIVQEQLSGYGFHYDYYDGVLVICDDCYSNDGLTEINEITPLTLLERAIEYRTEIISERYDDYENDEMDKYDAKCYKELQHMKLYAEYMRKAEEI